MPTFYVTFGVNDPTNAKRYQVIHAPSKDAARRLMHDTYGPKWAFLYDEREFCGDSDEFFDQRERYQLKPLPTILGVL